MPPPLAHRLVAAPLALALCLSGGSFAFANFSDDGVPGVSGSETLVQGDGGGTTSEVEPVEPEVVEPVETNGDDGATGDEVVSTDAPGGAGSISTTGGEGNDDGTEVVEGPSETGGLEITDGETTGGTGSDTTESCDPDADPDTCPESSDDETTDTEGGENGAVVGDETGELETTDLLTQEEFIEVSGITALDAEADIEELAATDLPPLASAAGDLSSLADDNLVCYTTVRGEWMYPDGSGVQSNIGGAGLCPNSSSYPPAGTEIICTVEYTAQNGWTATDTESFTYDGSGATLYFWIPLASPGLQALNAELDDTLAGAPPQNITWTQTCNYAGGTGTPYTLNASSSYSSPPIVAYLPFLAVFNANGGTGSMAPVSSGQSHLGGITTTPTGVATLPPNEFVRAGYVFSGWAVSGTGKAATVNTSNSTITGSLSSTITLTAQWQPVASFDPNGGAGTYPDIPIPTNSQVTMPAEPTPPACPDGTGRTFLGWSEGVGNIYQPGATATVPQSPTTFTAQWAACPATVTETFSSTTNCTTSLPGSQTLSGAAMVIGASFTIPAPDAATYTVGSITFNGSPVGVGDQVTLTGSDNSLAFMLSPVTLVAAAPSPIISDSAAPSGDAISGDAISVTPATWVGSSGATVTPDSVTYQGQTGNGDGDWVDVGAPSSSLQSLTVPATTPPGALYRLVATATLNCQSITENSNTLTVLDPIKASVTINNGATVAPNGTLLTAAPTCTDSGGNVLDESTGVVTYQWDANGSAIIGATGQTYQIPMGTKAGTQFTVGITCTNYGTNSVTVTSAAVTSVDPVLTVVASLSDPDGPSDGYTAPGDTITASTAFTFDDDAAADVPDSITYTWTATYPDGTSEVVKTAGPGAYGSTDNTLAVPAGAALGTVYSLVVTAQNLDTNPVQNTVIPQMIVALGALTGSVSITDPFGVAPDDAEIGQTLTANSTWQDGAGAVVTPDTVSYQWYQLLVGGAGAALASGFAPISGATGETYVVPVGTHVGTQFAVTATGVSAGLPPVVVDSASVTIVSPAVPTVTIVDTDAPSSGYALPGATLYAYPFYDPDGDGDNDAAACGTLVAGIKGACDTDGDPVSGVTYQWSNNGVPIPGATGQTFVVPANATNGDHYTVTAFGMGAGPVTSQVEPVETPDSTTSPGTPTPPVSDGEHDVATVVVTNPIDAGRTTVEVESDHEVTDLTYPGLVLTAVVEMDGVPVPLIDVLSYQWYIDCVPVEGATGRTFTVPAGTPDRAMIQVVAEMVNPTMPMVSNQVWVNQRGTSRNCSFGFAPASLRLTTTGSAGLGFALAAGAAVVVGTSLTRKRRYS